MIDARDTLHSLGFSFPKSEMAPEAVPLSFVYHLRGILRPYVMDEVREQFAEVLARHMTLEFDMASLVKAGVTSGIRLPMGVIGIPPEAGRGQTFIDRALGWMMSRCVRAMESTQRSLDFDFGVVCRLFHPLTLDTSFLVVKFMGEREQLVRMCYASTILEELQVGRFHDTEVSWLNWDPAGDNLASDLSWDKRKTIWEMVYGAPLNPIDIEIITAGDIKSIDRETIVPLLADEIPPLVLRKKAMARELEMNEKMNEMMQAHDGRQIPQSDIFAMAREIGSWIRENDDAIVQKHQPEIKNALVPELTVSHFGAS